MNIDRTLEERGKRYGNYLDQATISQQLLNIMQEALWARGKTLSPDQHDAMMMITVKLARVLNGDADYPDNWEDIAGYATLVASRLKGRSR